MYSLLSSGYAWFRSKLVNSTANSSPSHVFLSVNLFTEIGADVMEVGHRCLLWPHNWEDIIEHFSGEFPTNIHRIKCHMHYFYIISSGERKKWNIIITKKKWFHDIW